jgi:hypothetical protein
LLTSSKKGQGWKKGALALQEQLRKRHILLRGRHAVVLGGDILLLLLLIDKSLIEGAG